MITFAIANIFNIFEVTSSIEIFKICLISFVLGFLPILIQIISRYLRIGFMRDVLVQVRMLSYKSLLNRSVDAFRKESMESYQAQLVSDINLFESDFFLSILNIIYAFTNFFLGILVLIYISPIIALATLFVAVLLFILTKIFEKPTIRRKQRVLKENTSFHKSLTNILNGLETIKIYRVMDKFKENFYKDISQLEKEKKASNQISLYQNSLMQWIAGTYQVFTIIFVAYLFSQDKIGLTFLVVAFNLVGQLIWSVNHGFRMVNRFKASKEIFNNIVQVDQEQARKDFAFEDKIQVKDLSFAYKDKPIINNLNLTIKKNDKILIFGPTGTGKTTLVNLLSQNLSAYEGEILYDGLELNSVNNRSLVDKLGYVRQEHFIFNDSIRNNIVLDKEYDSAKLQKVLKESALDEWILSLDLKEDHILIDNGSNISGGQRQRINIARELYQDKEIIIFDEPSSSLDDQTSSKIYETIKGLEKTVIVISHRHLGFLSESFDQVVNLAKVGGGNIG